MAKDLSCGVIPVLLRDGVRHYLLVQHQAGHWGFPKGHPENGETHEQAARRELAEETGIAAVDLVTDPPFEEKYVFTKKSGKVVKKTVVYFVGHVESDAVQVQPEEVQAYAWGDAAATNERLTFDEGRELLSRVETFFSDA